MDAFISQLLPSIGLTIITTIVGQLISRSMSASSGPNAGSISVPLSPLAAAAPAPAPARRTSVNWGKVIIHVGILQLIVNVIGFVVGFAVGAAVLSSGGTEETAVTTAILIQIPLGTLVAVIAFYVIGVRVDRTVRWRHLTYVALGTIVATIVLNSLILQTPPDGLTFVVAATQTFLAMGIGGAFAARFGPKEQPYQPAAVMQPPPAGPPSGLPSYPPSTVPWIGIATPAYPLPGTYYPPLANGQLPPGAPARQQGPADQGQQQEKAL